MLRIRQDAEELSIYFREVPLTIIAVGVLAFGLFVGRFNVLVAAIAVACAVALAAWGGPIRVTARRSDGKVRMVKEGFLGFGRSASEWPLSGLLRADVDATASSSSKEGRMLLTNATLVFADQRVPLTTGTSGELQENRRLVAAVNRFVGLPGDGAQSVREVLVRALAERPRSVMVYGANGNPFVQLAVTESGFLWGQPVGLVIAIGATATSHREQVLSNAGFTRADGVVDPRALAPGTFCGADGVFANCGVDPERAERLVRALFEQLYGKAQVELSASFDPSPSLVSRMFQGGTA